MPHLNDERLISEVQGMFKERLGELYPDLTFAIDLHGNYVYLVQRTWVEVKKYYFFGPLVQREHEKLIRIISIFPNGRGGILFTLYDPAVLDVAESLEKLIVERYEEAFQRKLTIEIELDYQGTIDRKKSNSFILIAQKELKLLP